MSRRPVLIAVTIANVILVARLAAGLGVGSSDTVYTLENAILKAGISTRHGGAISVLIDKNRPDVNLINEHDQGRLVQQSYYAGPDPYRNAHWNGDSWPWNPISAGDVFGHHSKILALNHSDSEIYLKSVPLQWALDDVSCNCTFETRMTLDENGVFVRNRLKTFRYDTTKYGAMGQELPAVYTIGQFSVLWGVDAAGNLQQITYPVPGPPWANFETSESWAAFTMHKHGVEKHYGVGVWHKNITNFLGGFAGTPSPTAGSHNDCTGYMAPLGDWEIEAQDERVWCFRLAIGYLDDIRSYFNDPTRVAEPCDFN
jgi:hypothetical protein